MSPSSDVRRVEKEIRATIEPLGFVEVGDRIDANGCGYKLPIRVKGGDESKVRTVRKLVMERQDLPILGFGYPSMERPDSFDYDPKEHFEICYHER